MLTLCAEGSELCVVRGTRERDYVADVGHACYEEYKAFKSEAESGMRHCAETACVEIPPHVLHRDSQFVDAGKELVIVLLTLRAADYLPDVRESTSMARTVLPSGFCFM